MPRLELDLRERQLLERSGDLESTKLRNTSAIVSGAILILLIVVAMHRNVPTEWLGWVFVAYVAFTIWEKVTYGLAVLRYKRLINKLVDRLEELEPDGLA